MRDTTNPPPRSAAGTSATGVIGDILLREGALSPDEVRNIVELQRVKRLRFGEAAVHLGFLNDADVSRALASQYAYPYIKSGVCSLLDDRVFSAYSPFEKRAESLRTLRTQLTMRWFSEEHRALAVLTPGGDGHGSTLAANLAVTFAQLDERTLLIDANMRSPRQHMLFGVPNSEGLSSVLGGRCSFKSAVHRVAPFNRLVLLCAGPLPPNPQELLARDRFANLLALARTKFHAVIVDAPPALECADVQIIATRTVGCLVVARRHHTKIRDLQRISELLSPSGAQILGVTISD